MKKSILSGVAILAVFALFSFSTVENDSTTKETKIEEVKTLIERRFTRSERTFSDKFSTRREVWDRSNTNSQNEVLNKY